MSDFQGAGDAIEAGKDCTDCIHCQRNKKVDDRILDDSCYHPDLMQKAYYSGYNSFQTVKDFICILFEGVDNNE